MKGSEGGGRDGGSMMSLAKAQKYTLTEKISSDDAAKHKSKHTNDPIQETEGRNDAKLDTVNSRKF